MSSFADTTDCSSSGKMAQLAIQRRALVFSSSFGWMAMTVDGDTLTHLTFGRRSPRAAIEGLCLSDFDVARPTRVEQKLIDRLVAFTEGRVDDFLDVQIALSHLTPFQQQVVHQCRRIAYGTTATYGELAAHAGAPRAARAVGNVMAHNRIPLIVPCHRIVGAGKSLGGYSAPDGLRMKRRLLALEGSI